MTIRFFILQAHYRGTVDFSNEALQGAEKALQRMLEGFKRLQALKPSSETDNVDIASLEAKCYEALDDDFNTPVLLAHLFEACSIVNRINDGSLKASQNDIDGLRQLFNTFLVDILGIKVDSAAGETADGGASMKPFEQAVDLLLEMRSEAKARKDWTTSDLIRDRLAAIGFDVKDTKNGFEWSLKS